MYVKGKISSATTSGFQLLKITKTYARSLSFLRTKERFYDDVSAEKRKGVFFIQLDGKTVKTPLKNALYAPTKQLAMAVVSEWTSQRSLLKPHQMHLTALCNTCIDNPQQFSRQEMVDNILTYLHSDTICARTPAEESEVISQLQQDRWDPIVAWFNKRFSVNVQSSTEIFGFEQPKETIKEMRSLLQKLNTWQLTGLKFSIESLKSFIIPFAVIEKHLNLADALYLARLEVESQISKWGNVEWYHEIEHANQMAHLSAGILFYMLCSNMKHVEKL